MIKKSRKQNFIKARVISLFSGLSASLSFLGGWQICHSLCIIIIAALSLIGITVIGMPLLFLTQYAVYFWSTAVLLLVPTLIMYWVNRNCMSKNIILINIGIIVAAVPFTSLESYNLLFWTIGGVLIGVSIFNYIKGRFLK